MMRFILSWLKIQKKWLFLLFAGSLLISAAAVLIQTQQAEKWEKEQPEKIDLWYENTQIELIKGEKNPWNDYIGTMLSDLSLLQMLWKDPAANEQQIIEYENSYFSEALKSPEYCQRAMKLDPAELQTKLDLAAGYETRGWTQPLNPEKPRADYMVYSANHNFSAVVLLVLAVCCGIGVWIWAWIFESRAYTLLYALPYSKEKLFISLMILSAFLSLGLILVVYGSLWLFGWMVQGNLPLLIIENGQILPCSSTALRNMIFIILMAFSFSCIGAAAGVWIRNVTDTAMVLTMILMCLYFFFANVSTFFITPDWFWFVMLLTDAICLLLAWKKLKYES